MIYFVRGKKTKNIKIGFTSLSVRARISSLQTGSPDILIFLGACPGDRVYETQLHKLYQDDRLFGEWFKSSEKLLHFICQNCIQDIDNMEWVMSMTSNKILSFKEAVKLDSNELNNLIRKYSWLLASRTKFR